MKDFKKVQVYLYLSKSLKPKHQAKKYKNTPMSFEVIVYKCTKKAILADGF